MKKIVIVLCWLIPILVSAQEKPTIKFSKARNWKELQQEAVKNNKPIFIDAYATWCIPCKMMDKEVFSEKSVVEYINEHFVPIRIQMDSTNNDADIVKEWHKNLEAFKEYVTAYPAFIFFDQNGTYLGRELGFYKSEAFLVLLGNIVDPDASYASLIQKYKEGKLTKEQLFQLSKMAEKNKDSIQTRIGFDFKRLYLDPLPLDSILTPHTFQYIQQFFKAYHATDKIVRQMNASPDNTDQRFATTNFSARISDYLISRDFIYNHIMPNDAPVSKEPDWIFLSKNISREFGSSTAKRTILEAQLFWAYEHKRYAEAGKLELEKAERKGVDTTEMGRVFFNNMIYNIVFKHVEDTAILRKAASMMKYVTDLDKHQSANNLDTYAGILYKAGQKSKALEVENKALILAKEQNDTDRIRLFTSIIDKMQKGEKIWKLNLE